MDTWNVVHVVIQLVTIALVVVVSMDMQDRFDRVVQLLQRVLADPATPTVGPGVQTAEAAWTPTVRTEETPRAPQVGELKAGRAALRARLAARR